VTRLNRYLTEKAMPLQDKKAKKIVLSGVDKLENFFDKQGWNLNGILIASFLYVVYNKNNIKFGLGDKADIEISKQEGRDFVLGAGTTMGGEITVYINGDLEIKEKIEDFKNSKLIKELIDVLSHELVHREQWLRSKDKLVTKGFDPNMSLRKYLSLKFEIEAHAHDAALNIHRGDEAPELEVYKIFGIKHPVYKRFMKKVVQFKKELKKRDAT